MEKSAKGLPPLKRTKLSKNHNKGRMKFKRNYMKLISGGMNIDSNYIGTILNGLILNLTPKELDPFLFLQKRFTLVKVIEQLILLAILK